MKKLIIAALCLSSFAVNAAQDKVFTLKCNGGYSVIYHNGYAGNKSANVTILKGDDVEAQDENAEEDTASGFIPPDSVNGTLNISNFYVNKGTTAYYTLTRQTSYQNGTEHHSADLVTEYQLALDYTDVVVEVKAAKTFNCGKEVFKGQDF